MLEVKLVLVGGRATKQEIKLHLPTMIGRRNDSDLTICHPLVSRQHCELSERDGFLVVSDSGSQNGTFIGSKQISEVVLRDGDEFTVGPLTFKAVYLVPDEGGTNDQPAEAPQSAAPSEAAAVSASNGVDETFHPAESGLEHDPPTPEPDDEPSVDRTGSPVAESVADVSEDAADISAGLGVEEEVDLDLQLVPDDSGVEEVEEIESLAPLADSPREADSPVEADSPHEMDSPGEADAAATVGAPSTSSDDFELPADDASGASPASADSADELDEPADLSDPIGMAGQSEGIESAAAQEPADVDLDDLLLSTEDDLVLPAEQEAVDEVEPITEPDLSGSMSHGEETEDMFIAPVPEDAQEKDTKDAASSEASDEDSPALAVEVTTETEESEEIVFDELLLDEPEPPVAESPGEMEVEFTLEPSTDAGESEEFDLDDLALDTAEPPEADDQPTAETTHSPAEEIAPENVLPEAVDAEAVDAEPPSSDADDEALDIIEGLDQSDAAAGQDEPDFLAIEDDEQPGLMALGDDEGEPDFMALDDSSDDLAIDDLEELDFVDTGADAADSHNNGQHAQVSPDLSESAGASEPVVAPSGEENTATNGESGPAEKKKRSLWPFGRKRSSKKKGRSKKADADMSPATAPLEPVASDTEGADSEEIPIFESTDISSAAGDETDLAEDAAIDFLSLDDDDDALSAIPSDADAGEPVESTPPSDVSDEDLDDFLKGLD